jgi:hypothetical protein
MAQITAMDMIKYYLVKNDFDGLVNGGCACGVDNLAPCGYEGRGCCAAKFFDDTINGKTVKIYYDPSETEE